MSGDKAFADTWTVLEMRVTGWIRACAHDVRDLPYSAWETVDRLHESHDEWCRSNGLSTMTKADFGFALSILNLPRRVNVRDGEGIVIRPLVLLPEPVTIDPWCQHPVGPPF